ncbi:MAG: VOC family protein [Anaerolineae bacterium]
MHIMYMHHANISIPSGKENEARTFYCDLLGMQEFEKPQALMHNGGFWLKLDNIDLHISIQDGIERLPLEMHLAYQVNDLAQWRDRLEDAGVTIHPKEDIPDFDRFEIIDPFGNHIELLEVK